MAPRGGNQPPRRPAAVSNPQSGQRTDGGPGSSKQPIRVPTGGNYGEAGASAAQQGAAPMAAGGPSAPGAPQPAGPDAATALGGGGGGGGGMFGPTQRPGESNSANMAGAQNPLADTDAALRIMFSMLPHPNIQRMMNRKRDYR